jgi:hypothetical protein
MDAWMHAWVGGWMDNNNNNHDNNHGYGMKWNGWAAWFPWQWQPYDT